MPKLWLIFRYHQQQQQQQQQQKKKEPFLAYEWLTPGVSIITRQMTQFLPSFLWALSVGIFYFFHFNNILSWSALTSLPNPPFDPYSSVQICRGSGGNRFVRGRDRERINGYAPPIMENFFIFRENTHNLRNF